GDGTVTKTMLDSTVQASLGKADTAMQSIGDGTVTKTMLDSGVQTSLGKADTAVQPAAITDMQEKSLMVSDNNEYNAATDKTAVYPSASYMIAAIEGAQSDLNSDIQKAQETADANALAIENLDGTYLTDSEFATFKTSNSGAIAAAQKAGDDAQADLDAYQESNDAALAGVKATAEAAVVANSAITAGTGSVITYDAKGLVTSGRALVASDIPTIEQSQVNGLGASLTGATNAALQGIADATTGVTDGVWTLTMKVAGDTTTFGWEEISR
ncbi:MAG: hypothetical protein J6L47_00030, partial [Alphaproteobacteria bacterium]|nr:hypothetical protein [Alphaproteobacteria bacterium]